MAARLSNYPVIRDSQGEQTDPTTSVVLADTGAISDALGGGGIYEVMVVASASAAAKISVQVRNVANDANVGDVHTFYVPATATIGLPFRFEIERNQRVRALVATNLTGTAIVSIVAQRAA